MKDGELTAALYAFMKGQGRLPSSSIGLQMLCAYGIDGPHFSIDLSNTPGENKSTSLSINLGQPCFVLSRSYPVPLFPTPKQSLSSATHVKGLLL
jgi:hypothetical protein